ncbi:TonB-dependent receptor family protein [Ramlibacter rhizophilus]|uniref:TonB-dependent receptor n=1 Tax=Ramlibacter rhizophilus TaxID=1781167 RepID=A0A4Z0BCG2_9BURK|nr:TonB-dependent receptor [Ramlibacter rhizophilus]TFY96956.1 TonB-dependent receptor [Ramlibacter rhizophilus]
MLRASTSLPLVCLLWALEAAAQDSTPALPTVTVTATPGVEQSVFDTPASVDVVPGEVLRNAQWQVNLSESLGRVPGLVVQNRQNFAQDLQISIRGFGARSTFGVRGLRLYADGIPAAGPDGQGQVSHFDLASAERIEVLRGPFSALYGNASGGVISIFTEDGGPDTVAEVSTAFGDNGARRLTTQIGGAAQDWRYRLSATRFETDGLREHSAAQRSSLNGKLTHDAGGGTRLTLVFNHLQMPGTQDPLGLTRAQWEAEPRQAQPAAILFDTRKSVRQTQAGAVLEHTLARDDELRLMAYAGERDTLQFLAIPVAVQAAPSQPGGVIDLLRRYAGLDARWVHRGRGPAGPYTLSTGLALEATRDLRRGWENFDGAQLGVRGDLRRDEVNRAWSVAPYLQGQWVLGERWSASAGLRHTRVRFDSEDRFIRPGNPDDSGAVRYRATTPALGLVFHASDLINAYIAYGRGFETPTLNELAYRAGGSAGLNADLQPAISRQWELGLKAASGEDWSLAAAVFQARTSEELVVLSNAGGRASFQNAPGTLRRGLELVGKARWNTAWSGLLAATWLDATYRQPFLTCTGAPCFVPTALVGAGQRMPGIPRTSLYGELAWQHRPWGLETALELRHVGEVAVNDLNTDSAPAYSTLALRATLEQRRGPWLWREFVRIDNLTERRYAGSVIVNEGNQRFFEPAPGRQWVVGVSAAYRF